MRPSTSASRCTVFVLHRHPCEAAAAEEISSPSNDIRGGQSLGSRAIRMNSGSDQRITGIRVASGRVQKSGVECGVKAEDMHSLVQSSRGDGLEETIGEQGRLVHQLVRVEDDPADSGSSGLEGEVGDGPCEHFAGFTSGSVTLVFVCDVLNKNDEVGARVSA